MLAKSSEGESKKKSSSCARILGREFDWRRDEGRQRRRSIRSLEDSRAQSDTEIDVFLVIHTSDRQGMQETWSAVEI
jgi:hypothetical protein